MSTRPQESLSALGLHGVAFRCRQETERFWRKQPYDSAFCFELFRRALAEPNQARSKQAWNLLHQHYQRQVVIWVKGHSWFSQTGQEPDMLADLALEKMWVSFASNPDKFSRFPREDADKCLRSLLRFLKACVHSVVVDAISPPSVDDEETLAREAVHDPDPTVSEEFWRCIYSRLNSEKERLVVDASYVYDLKPRQILELYPDRFDAVKEIYRIKENVLARLQRDGSLQECLGESR